MLNLLTAVLLHRLSSVTWRRFPQMQLVPAMILFMFRSALVGGHFANPCRSPVTAVNLPLFTLLISVYLFCPLINLPNACFILYWNMFLVYYCLIFVGRPFCNCCRSPVITAIGLSSLSCLEFGVSVCVAHSFPYLFTQAQRAWAREPWGSAVLLVCSTHMCFLDWIFLLCVFVLVLIQFVNDWNHVSCSLSKTRENLKETWSW